jgi:hypothetical protein
VPQITQVEYAYQLADGKPSILARLFGPQS